jgi:FixJ family two-component response regulator
MSDAPTAAEFVDILLVDNAGDVRLTKGAFKFDANAYLTKPVDPDEFIEVVRRFKSFWLDAVRLPPEEVKR